MAIDFFAARREQLLALAAELVKLETPSGDKVHCDLLAELLVKRLGALGQVERVASAEAGDHVLLRVAAPDAPAEARPALLLCHYDTVWPLGTLARRPFSVEGDVAFGPGLYDMKISIAMAALALGSLGALGIRLPRPLLFLITSDEETGSATSRALIETMAAQCAFALVLEPPVEPHGALKTARKGIGGYTVAIEGRAAHAGVEPEKGISAVTELAHQIRAVNALANGELGTTVNVGMVAGGSGRNVVPAAAHMEVDVRAWTQPEAARLDAGFRALTAATPGALVRASGGFNRPPMERTPGSIALFEHAKAIGAGLGLALTEGSTGGGSDGNFTAALGVPTLDGLGSPGKGAHAEHEQIHIPGAIERAALLAALLGEL